MSDDPTIAIVLHDLRRAANGEIGLIWINRGSAKILVDHINLLSSQAEKLHAAGQDCVSRAFEYGEPEDDRLTGDSEVAQDVAHHVSQPMRSLIGRPSEWAQQVVVALKNHMEAGG